MGSEVPKAPLLPGEEWKDIIGDPGYSLSLTTHRVIQIVEDQGRMECETLFLDRVDSVRYSRHIEWGYLWAAILSLILIIGAGMIVNSQAGKGGSSAGTVLEVLGVGLFVVLLVLFLNSRKARLKIYAGNQSIEVVSEARAMDGYLAFIQKVQAAVIERSPGPKVKAQLDE
jgi:hypothetical protein